MPGISNVSLGEHAEGVDVIMRGYELGANGDSNGVFKTSGPIHSGGNR